MKKKAIILMFLCVGGLISGFSQTKENSKTKTIEIITSAVRAVVEIYKTIPEAEYIVTWYDAYGQADYGKVSSKAEAEAIMRVALSKGASKVHIRSVYGSTDEWYPPELLPNQAWIPGTTW